MKQDPIFSSFLIKVASRCNLNCAYCYMYQHADQSWKDKPLVLSEKHQQLFVDRLYDYAQEKSLDKVLVIYHGGEPLIFGADKLVNFSKAIKKRLDTISCQVDFGIQTNGTLLKEEHLKLFVDENISVSLSIDGPKKIHNVYRLDHKGNPSFDKVYRALALLKKYPQIFSGCIAVINVNYSPRELFQFFSENEVEEFNILLPDANYTSPPIGRDQNPDVYIDWLIEAFDCWSAEFPHIQCKFFESIILALLGKSGQTDALGLGDVSLLNIETDGMYHDLDVLKITKEGYSSLGIGLETAPISAAAQSKNIEVHRKLLSKEGLSKTCLACKHVDICGGGSVPHRFGTEGFDNPTIYCKEMYALIDHISEKLIQLVDQELEKNESSSILFSQKEMEDFCIYSNSEKQIRKLQEYVAQKKRAQWERIAVEAKQRFPSQEALINQTNNQVSSVGERALMHPVSSSFLDALEQSLKGKVVEGMDGTPLPIDIDFLHLIGTKLLRKEEFVIQENHDWYTHALGKDIVFNHPQTAFDLGKKVIEDALGMIQEYDTHLYDEMKIISPYIYIVKDKNSPPDRDISFADETLPGAIFIGVWKGNRCLAPYKVAASMIHEHCHQKLYLLQERFEIIEPQDVEIYSPWPEKYRPPIAALHAVYVFIHVAKFLNHVAICDQNLQEEIDLTLERIDGCISEIQEKVQFTPMGALFFESLLKEWELLKSQSLCLT
ncbi:cyclophane-forming radical SAM/SPASM peptide maturase YhhB [Candidatus Neptunochlamydia vexilliferae]|uniref:Radical SAM core domain-containing protein n=1 Tax=Candidatus Neptunichlamydia vexilliferae TaxID=1651774 RepID=A0ABS0AZT2_9BACT|nr:cyclophane-forming radical SAM/SPASM peptide maturase YhhB [Candidatus Neptunochlamydia vexilliferae]MBF5058840.1 hypothetical protein [Candidatus Neptunochlamydia vexilliferae]